MKTFTSDTGAPREFMVDDDVYRCAAQLPAGAAKGLAKITKAKAEDKLMYIGDFLDMVLLPDDAKRFAKRIEDPTHPITLETFGAIVEWVLEEYTGRPTVPPSSSVNGQSIIGTGSMDGALQET